MDSAAAHLYKEEDVKPAQPDRVHGDEVRGQDLVGVLAHELAPGALASPRRWLLSVAAEHLADGEVGTAVAQLAQLAHNPSVAQPSFSIANLRMRSCSSLRTTGRCRPDRRR